MGFKSKEPKRGVQKVRSATVRVGRNCERAELAYLSGIHWAGNSARSEISEKFKLSGNEVCGKFGFPVDTFFFDSPQLVLALELNAYT